MHPGARAVTALVLGAAACAAVSTSPTPTASLPFDAARISTLVSRGGTNTGPSANISNAHVVIGSIALDSARDLIYVSDYHNSTAGINLVRCINVVTGAVTIIAGGGASASDGTIPATSALISRPTCVALHPNGADLFVVEHNTGKIKRVMLGPATITTVLGNGSLTVDGVHAHSTVTGPRNVTAIAVGFDGTLFFHETQPRCRIRAVHPGTLLVTTIAGNGACAERAVFGSFIGEFPGGFNQFAGGPATSVPLFTSVSMPPVQSLAVEQRPGGAQYFAANATIYAVQGGVLTHVAGTGDRDYMFSPSLGLVEGPGTSAALLVPVGLALDPLSGDLLVIDRNIHCIARVANNSARTVTRVAGHCNATTVLGSPSDGDGSSPLAATLTFPSYGAAGFLRGAPSLVFVDTAERRSIRVIAVPASATPTGTSSGTASYSTSATATGSVSASPTRTVTATATMTAPASPTATPSPTGSMSASGAQTATPTESTSGSGTGTGSWTQTALPTVTQTGTPTVSVTASGTPTVSGSATGTQSSTVSSTSGTRTSSLSESPSSSSGSTPTATATGTASASAASSRSPTPTESVTPTPSPTSDPTPTSSGTATGTASASGTPTPTGTASSTAPGAGSATPTGTSSLLPQSPTASPSSAVTNSATLTTSGSPTPSQNPAATVSSAPSGTSTPSRTASPSLSAPPFFFCALADFPLMVADASGADAGALAAAAVGASVWSAQQRALPTSCTGAAPINVSDPRVCVPAESVCTAACSLDAVARLLPPASGLGIHAARWGPTAYRCARGVYNASSAVGGYSGVWLPVSEDTLSITQEGAAASSGNGTLPSPVSVAATQCVAWHLRQHLDVLPVQGNSSAAAAIALDRCGETLRARWPRWGAANASMAGLLQQALLVPKGTWARGSTSNSSAGLRPGDPFYTEAVRQAERLSRALVAPAAGVTVTLSVSAPALCGTGSSSNITSQPLEVPLVRQGQPVAPTLPGSASELVFTLSDATTSLDVVGLTLSRDGSGSILSHPTLCPGGARVVATDSSGSGSGMGASAGAASDGWAVAIHVRSVWVWNDDGGGVAHGDGATHGGALSLRLGQLAVAPNGSSFVVDPSKGAETWPEEGGSGGSSSSSSSGDACRVMTARLVFDGARPMPAPVASSSGAPILSDGLPPLTLQPALTVPLQPGERLTLACAVVDDEWNNVAAVFPPSFDVTADAAAVIAAGATLPTASRVFGLFQGADGLTPGTAVPLTLRCTVTCVTPPGLFPSYGTFPFSLPLEFIAASWPLLGNAWVHTKDPVNPALVTTASALTLRGDAAAARGAEDPLTADPPAVSSFEVLATDAVNVTLTQDDVGWSDGSGAFRLGGRGRAFSEHTRVFVGNVTCRILSVAQNGSWIRVETPPYAALCPTPPPQANSSSIGSGVRAKEVTPDCPRRQFSVVNPVLPGYGLLVSCAPFCPTGRPAAAGMMPVVTGFLAAGTPFSGPLANSSAYSGATAGNASSSLTPPTPGAGGASWPFGNLAGSSSSSLLPEVMVSFAAPLALLGRDAPPPLLRHAQRLARRANGSLDVTSRSLISQGAVQYYDACSGSNVSWRPASDPLCFSPDAAFRDQAGARMCAFGAGTACTLCPVGAHCPGGRQALPLLGWWAANPQNGALEGCSPPSQDRCAGWDRSQGEAECGPGYRGLLCERCKPRHFSDDDGQCQPCRPLTQVESALRALALVAASILAMTLLVLLATLLFIRLLGGGSVKGALGQTYTLLFLFIELTQLQLQVGGTMKGVVGLPEPLRRLYASLDTLQLIDPTISPQCFERAEVLGLASALFGAVAGFLALLALSTIRLRLTPCCSRYPAAGQTDAEANAFDARLASAFSDVTSSVGALSLSSVTWSVGQRVELLLTRLRRLLTRGLASLGGESKRRMVVFDRFKHQRAAILRSLPTSARVGLCVDTARASSQLVLCILLTLLYPLTVSVAIASVNCEDRVVTPRQYLALSGDGTALTRLGIDGDAPVCAAAAFGWLSGGGGACDSRAALGPDALLDTLVAARGATIPVRVLTSFPHVVCEGPDYDRAVNLAAAVTALFLVGFPLALLLAGWRLLKRYTSFPHLSSWSAGNGGSTKTGGSPGGADAKSVQQPQGAMQRAEHSKAAVVEHSNPMRAKRKTLEHSASVGSHWGSARTLQPRQGNAPKSEGAVMGAVPPHLSGCDPFGVKVLVRGSSYWSRLHYVLPPGSALDLCGVMEYLFEGDYLPGRFWFKVVDLTLMALLGVAADGLPSRFDTSSNKAGVVFTLLAVLALLLLVRQPFTPQNGWVRWIRLFHVGLMAAIAALVCVVQRSREELADEARRVAALQAALDEAYMKTAGGRGAGTPVLVAAPPLAALPTRSLNATAEVKPSPLLDAAERGLSWLTLALSVAFLVAVAAGFFAALYTATERDRDAQVAHTREVSAHVAKVAALQQQLDPSGVPLGGGGGSPAAARASLSPYNGSPRGRQVHAAVLEARGGDGSPRESSPRSRLSAAGSGSSPASSLRYSQDGDDIDGHDPENPVLYHHHGEPQQPLRPPGGGSFRGAVAASGRGLGLADASARRLPPATPSLGRTGFDDDSGMRPSGASSRQVVAFQPVLAGGSSLGAAAGDAPAAPGGSGGSVRNLRAESRTLRPGPGLGFGGGGGASRRGVFLPSAAATDG